MILNYDELVALLCNGISHRKLYFEQHPKVLKYSQDFADQLQKRLETEGKEFFFLGVVDGMLVHNGRYLVGPTIVGRRLVLFAENLRCGGFLFSQRIETEEIGCFFNLAAEIIEPVEHLVESGDRFKARGIVNIELSPVYEDHKWYGQYFYEGQEAWESGSLSKGRKETMIPMYQSLFNTVEASHNQAGSGQAIDMNETRTISRKLLQSTQGDFKDIMQLVRYPDYDSYTVGHSVRVALMVVLVGCKLGMDEESLQELGTAALLHDEGKAKIPEEILFKTGRLEEEERRTIEKHTRLGAQILMENQETSSLAIGAAWGHHLRHDHNGYPKQPGWAVNGNVTALLHVCDVFEALTAVRPYKKAMSPRKAYETMLLDEGAFDPAALTCFISAMGLYPPGSRVLLSSGEQGTVITAGSDFEKPHVQITHDPRGIAYSIENMRNVDLSGDAEPGLEVTSLVLDETATSVAGK
ncbi:MAG: HD domain-containing phosphohydrolase [Planctomycetota bacterium]